MMISFFAVHHDWLPAGGYVPFREDPIANLEHMRCRRSSSERVSRRS